MDKSPFSNYTAENPIKKKKTSLTWQSVVRTCLVILPKCLVYSSDSHYPIPVGRWFILLWSRHLQCFMGIPIFGIIYIIARMRRIVTLLITDNSKSNSNTHIVILITNSSYQLVQEFATVHRMWSSTNKRMNPLATALSRRGGAAGKVGEVASTSSNNLGVMVYIYIYTHRIL